MKLDFKNNKALLQWWNLRQKAVALLTCIAVYVYIRNSRKRKICYSMSPEWERLQEELMSQYDVESQENGKQNETLDDSIQQENSSGSSSVTSRKKQKVTYSNENDSDIRSIKDAIDELIAALREGNESIGAPRMTGAEVWKTIKEFGFSQIDTTKLYRVLMCDVRQLAAFTECPLQARADFLNEVMKDFGST